MSITIKTPISDVIGKAGESGGDKGEKPRTKSPNAKPEKLYENVTPKKISIKTPFQQ